MADLNSNKKFLFNGCYVNIKSHFNFEKNYSFIKKNRTFALYIKQKTKRKTKVFKDVEVLEPTLTNPILTLKPLLNFCWVISNLIEEKCFYV